MAQEPNLTSQEKGKENVKKEEEEVKETIAATVPPPKKAWEIQLEKCASFKPDISMFPDRGPRLPDSDIDALVKWVRGPPWTDDQSDNFLREHSLHFHGVEDYKYPRPRNIPWIDQLPEPSDPDFEAAFEAGCFSDH